MLRVFRCERCMPVDPPEAVESRYCVGELEWVGEVELFGSVGVRRTDDDRAVASPPCAGTAPEEP